MYNLGVFLLGLTALPIIGVGLMSVVTLFLPSRHPEEEERFGSAKRIINERRQREKARWLAD